MSEKQSELEQRLMVGLHGTPELKHHEKVQHLGQFRERIIRLLTKDQVEDNHVYPEIEEALKDPRAIRLLLNGDLAYRYRDKYIKIARKHSKPYTVVNDPSLKGNAGLVVVADHAVDVDKIEVK
ncbi:MAG TPA: YueI family protein [Desulfitobacterium dehalogenans]|uniref:YueI family protein n=1 Tax=Desulfitobacterium dehalogenans TaxID=36854 RepID=A0A7C7D5K2_9FIRM|nr:YueI family protein [Desulfitobacterium dehalogenans]